MRHRKRQFKVGRRPDHVRSMLANQVCSLITEEQIQTTVVKAKETRRLAEKMVTLGKKGTLHHRREAISKLHDKDAVAKLFSEVAPRYMDRDGGYTRIIRLGARRGDAAEVCILEWVDEGSTAKKSSKKKAKKEEAPVEEAAAEEAAEEATDEAAAEEAEEATPEAEETPAEEEAPAAEAEEADAAAEEAADEEEKKED